MRQKATTKQSRRAKQVKNANIKIKVNSKQCTMRSDEKERKNVHVTSKFAALETGHALDKWGDWQWSGPRATYLYTLGTLYICYPKWTA